jgi:predicted RNase H-like HicB family nuclease
MRFALALLTEDGVQYGVTIPVLPGCFSAGETLDEAVVLAREAIDAHCELLEERGIDLPLPRSLASTKRIQIS